MSDTQRSTGESSHQVSARSNIPPIPTEGMTSVTAPTTLMELEHAVGFSGLRFACHMIPGTSKYVTVAGGCIVVGSIDDPHDQVFLRGHDDDITCLKVSESGRFMVSGQKGHNADVCLWDIASQKIIRRFAEHEGSVTAVEISADDALLATIGGEGKLTFFDTSNGGVVTHLPLGLSIPETDTVVDTAFGGRVQDIKRRPTNLYHFSVLTKSMVFVMHLDPYQGTITPVRLNLSSFQRKLSSLQYTTNGDFIVLGSEAGDMAFVNTATGTIACTQRVCTLGIRDIAIYGSHLGDIQRNLDDSEKAFKYARFGPGSERSTTIFVGGGDGTVTLVYVADHGNPAMQLLSKRTIDGPVASLSIAASHDSNFSVLCTTANGFTVMVELSAVGHDTKDPVRISDAVTAKYDVLGVHPTAPDRFVTGSSDGILRLWDLNNYKILGQFEFSNKTTARSTALNVAEGLEIMLSSWTDGCVRCHDLTDFKLLWTHARAHRAEITSLCVSPSMKFFVTGSAEGDIKIWDMRTRELRGELKDHRQAIVALQLFEDDKHLLSASKDRTVVTWDLVTLKRVTCHETHNGPLTSTFLSRNQSNFYTAGQDHRVCMWDLRYKEPSRSALYAPAGSEAYCTCMRKNMDERLLATGGTDELVQLWDERMFEIISTGAGHSGTVTDVAFTADNKQVISCATDYSVMVWNVYA